ncbi:pre-mRNA-splicing factor 38A-like [Lytechinus variegatus]|uniref:pre-mRNA-splicing factor 38A-like n=1 Tax=Lytechinus variegatus TaxID=7654 RepID=UPI001BB2BA6A|nr:pre-mRNA-splicing factor 38A-like [Lytechinus variegatus]
MTSRRLLENFDALELKEDSTCRLVRMDPVPPHREDKDPRISQSLRKSPCHSDSRSPRRSERANSANHSRSRSPRRRSRTPQKDMPKSSIPDCPKSPQPERSEVSPRHGRNSTPEPEEEQDYDERSPSPLDLRYASRKVVSEMPSPSDWSECTGKDAERQADNPCQRIQTTLHEMSTSRSE